MQNEGLRANALNWNGSSTFMQVMDEINNGNLDAYIFDKPILSYWKSVFDTSCE